LHILELPEPFVGLAYVPSVETVALSHNAKTAVAAITTQSVRFVGIHRPDRSTLNRDDESKSDWSFVEVIGCWQR
jgi:hypothetical protein